MRKNTRSDLFSVIIPTLNEEENIGQLVRSLYDQDHRPIEVLIVDGRSTDKTVEIVKTLKGKLEDPSFKVKIILEGKVRGLSRARNVGLKNSTGKYVTFVDADVILNDTSLLKKLNEALRKQPLVLFKQRMIVDSWLESNVFVDQGGQPFSSLAYRREVLDKVMFDPNLGAGDDHDLLYRLRERGILSDKTETVDAEAGFHDVHTLKEFTIQRFWHARTIWSFIRKRPRTIASLVIQLGPFGLLLLAVIGAAIDLRISLACIATWAVAVSYLFIKSSLKNPSRLAYILLVCSYGSMVRAVGALKGLYDYIRGNTTLGRDV